MYSRIYKAIFDRVFASISVLLLGPLLLIVAALIKISSPGPVFFFHTRVGLRGTPFRVIKFRSYFVEACGTGDNLTVEGDSRVTSIGKVIRAYKIDELPQLLNVIMGQMSIVGPRPEVLEYVEEYPTDARAAILSVRPGITGPTQLRFSNEEKLLAAADDPDRYYREKLLPKKIESDVRYSQSITLFGDLLILVQTVLMLLGASPGIFPRDLSDFSDQNTN